MRALALLLAIGCTGPAAASVPMPRPVEDTRQRVVSSGDHGDAPFIVIDKVQARLWLFDARGRRQSDTAVLLGLALGDHSVAGIGERHLSKIRDHERTTPAGRFVAEPGLNLAGEDIIWLHYDAAVSIHRVRASDPRERRLQRLSSATPADNRISYGCINTPAAFYDRWLAPLIRASRPVIYVLPEVRAAGAPTAR